MLNEMIEEGIITVTFENGKTNSLDLEMLRALRAIVKKANEDDSIKGIILTGAGRTFCSGFDLPMFMSFKDIDAVGNFFDEVELILVELIECHKPVISPINCHAIAGGLIFAMARDYRIVKNHPKISIGMSEIKLGLALTIAQSEIMQFGYDSHKKFRDLMYFGRMLDVKGQGIRHRGRGRRRGRPAPEGKGSYQEVDRQSRQGLHQAEGRPEEAHCRPDQEEARGGRLEACLQVLLRKGRTGIHRVRHGHDVKISRGGAPGHRAGAPPLWSPGTLS
jgi:hypothetical protein